MLEYANERQQNGNLTISKLRTEYSTLTASCRTLGETRRTLSADVTRLDSQRNQLQSGVDKLLAEHQGLSQRLLKERQTDQTLTQYVYDKAQLKALGVDIDNVGRARQFFGEMALHNYNASYVAAQLMNNPTLSAVTRNLGQEVNDLVTRKAALTKEIEEIDAKRRAAERRQKKRKRMRTRE